VSESEPHIFFASLFVKKAVVIAFINGVNRIMRK